MPYVYKLNSKVLKRLKKLDPQIRKKIIVKLDWVCEQEEPLFFARRLVDYELGEFRLRVGDWRVVFDVDEKNKVLKILDVDHRKNIYR